MALETTTGIEEGGVGRLKGTGGGRLVHAVFGRYRWPVLFSIPTSLHDSLEFLSVAEQQHNGVSQAAATDVFADAGKTDTEYKEDPCTLLDCRPSWV